MNDDWERAKTDLQNLQTKLPAVGLDARLRHEIENALAISQANIEAVFDGIMEPTPERLKHVQDALAVAASRLT